MTRAHIAHTGLPIEWCMRVLVSFVLVLPISESYVVCQDRGVALLTIVDEEKREVVLYEESHALVIGISDYQHWRDLPGVKDDLISVEKALEERGFKIALLPNPTSAELTATLDDFVRRKGRKPNARVLVYFAGHGWTRTDELGVERGYIVPTEAPVPIRDEDGFLNVAIDMSQMRSFAERIESKHALFIFDSCFSGALISLKRSAPRAITESTGYPVRQFMTSGKAGEEVPDDSVFRRSFVRALSGEGDYEILSRVVDQLSESSGVPRFFV